MEEEPMYVTDISMNYLASVEEEEKYRLQALDNSLGHVAVKVKEQIDDKDSGVSSHIIYSNKDVSSGILGGTLIQSMIHAATGSTILKENIKSTNEKSESDSVTAIRQRTPSCNEDQNHNITSAATNDNDTSRNKTYNNDRRRRIDAEEEFDTFV
jgi:hypothetical protein